MACRWRWATLPPSTRATSAAAMSMLSTSPSAPTISKVGGVATACEGDMGHRQEIAIGAAIVPIFSARNSGTLCCTIETVNAEGQDVAIQVMHDSINIAPHPFYRPPPTRL